MNTAKIIAKKINHKSGFSVEIEVCFYEEIKKYSAGFLIVNPDGLKTNRIAPDSTMYSTEQAAEESSIAHGKETLIRHISGGEELCFKEQ
jgi:hypothetical protein